MHTSKHTQPRDRENDLKCLIAQIIIQDDKITRPSKVRKKPKMSQSVNVPHVKSKILQVLIFPQFSIRV